jgi:ABC transporter substrate binding protein
MRHQGHRVHLLAIVVFVLPFALAHAEKRALTVLYPADISAADQALFEQVLEGIHDAASDTNVILYQADTSDGRALRRFLREQEPERIITLGRSAFDAYNRHRRTVDPDPIVGALDITPDTHPRTRGVSMDVTPEQLFERLKILAPEVSRVLVVYDPHRDTSNVRRAMSAASMHGLMLKGFHAMDPNQSSTHFANLFRYANPKTDALWLPPDMNLIRTDTHLPMIIKESWGRRFVVFSSNSEHAKKGVLFSVYPDMSALGEALVRLAISTSQQRSGLDALEQVESSLNVRLARHLNLEITPETMGYFDDLVRED